MTLPENPQEFKNDDNFEEYFTDDESFNLPDIDFSSEKESPRLRASNDSTSVSLSSDKIIEEIITNDLNSSQEWNFEDLEEDKELIQEKQEDPEVEEEWSSLLENINDPENFDTEVNPEEEDWASFLENLDKEDINDEEDDQNLDEKEKWDWTEISDEEVSKETEIADEDQEDLEFKQYLERLRAKEELRDNALDEENQRSIEFPEIPTNVEYDKEDEEDDSYKNFEEEEYIPEEDIIPTLKSEKVQPKTNKESKFKDIISQIKSELKGGDEKPNQKKEAEQKDSDSAPIIKPHLFFANLFYSMITGFLKVLAKIPLLGLIFKFILKFTKILKIVSHILPYVFILIVLFLISYFSVPKETDIILPDNGAATFNNFNFDLDTLTASGTIINEGDVIAKVTPTFSVYSLNPTWNPKTWIIPTKQSVCVGEIMNIDIDSYTTIEVKCDTEPDGFWMRINGELN